MIPDINLLPKREKKSSTLKIVIILAVSIVLIAAIVATVIFKVTKSEIEAASLEQQRLQAQLTQYQATHEVLVAESNRNTLQGAVTFIESVSYAVSPIIDTTEKHLLPHSYLRNYAFAETQVTITVDFESIKDASDYVAALIKDAYFKDVQLTSVTNFEVDPTGTEQTDQVLFKEIPRYTANITMEINQSYLAGGGENE